MPTEDNMLNVLLTEYSALREELKSKFINQITIFGIIVSALGISYSISLKDSGALRYFVLLVPFITIPLGLKAQHSNHGIQIMGEYLTYLETLIQKHSNSNNWCGWQNYWNFRHDKQLVFFHDALSKYVIYLVIPVGIALIYLLFIGYFTWFILYLLMIVALGSVFYYYRKRLNNEYVLCKDRLNKIFDDISSADVNIGKVSPEEIDEIDSYHDKNEKVEKIIDEIKKIQDLRITNYPDVLTTKKEFEQMKKDIEGFKEKNMNKKNLQLFSKRMQEGGKPELPYCPKCGRRSGVYWRKHKKPSLRCHKCGHTFEFELIK